VSERELFQHKTCVRHQDSIELLIFVLTIIYIHSGEHKDYCQDKDQKLSGMKKSITLHSIGLTSGVKIIGESNVP
jgi:hypothetical protein